MVRRGSVVGLVGVLIALLSTTAVADIYKYVDRYGRSYFTDRPDHKGYKKLVHTWKGWREPARSYAGASVNRKKFAPTIASVAAQHALPPALLHAVITAESSYNPDAVSKAGAVGLMQLMPATAQRYGVRNRHDPAANLSGGTRYLRDLLQMFDDDLSLALAAYNAGENAVIRHGRKIPPYEETQTYVRRVLQYYERYRQEM